MRKRRAVFWIFRIIFLMIIIVTGIRAYKGNQVVRDSVVKTAEVIDEGQVYHKTNKQYDQDSNHEYETTWYQTITVQFDVEGEKKETKLSIELRSKT